MNDDWYWHLPSGINENSDSNEVTKFLGPNKHTYKKCINTNRMRIEISAYITRPKGSTDKSLEKTKFLYLLARKQ